MFGSGHDEVFLGRDFAQANNYSESIAAEIDSEIRSIIVSAYDKTKEILQNRFEKLTQIATFLFDNEKMSGEQFEGFFKDGPIPELPMA
jgi:cell division protease FtsH